MKFKLNSDQSLSNLQLYISILYTSQKLKKKINCNCKLEIIGNVHLCVIAERLDMYRLTTKLCDFHIADIYCVDVLTVYYSMCQQADNMLLSFLFGLQKVKVVYSTTMFS